MEANFKSGDLVKIKSGARAGQVGKIAERSSERQALYQVEFPMDLATVFFLEDELEKAEGIPCPKCLEKGKWNQLSDPYQTAEGWVQNCPIHDQFYLWGWFKSEAGEAIDLLTGKSLKI